MNTTMRRQRTVAWLCAACMGLLPPAPIGAQEAKPRHVIKAPAVPGDWGERGGYLLVSMMEFRVGFSSDGKMVIGAQNFVRAGKEVNGAVKMWDVATAKELDSLPFDGWILSVALTADGKTVAVGGQSNVEMTSPCVRLWNIETRKEREFPAPNGSLAWTPDGKTLAIGTAGRNDEKGHGVVKLWDIPTAKERASLKARGGDYCRVTISKDGTMLAAVSGEHPGDPGMGSGSITLWDLPAGKERDPLPESDSFTCVAFSPDGKTLAGGGAGIVLWDLATSQKLATLKAHVGRITSLAFTPDGKTLASSAGDSDIRLASKWGQVKLWDAASGKVTATLKGFRFPPMSMAFSPDGRTLATFCLGEVQLWDIPASK